MKWSEIERLVRIAAAPLARQIEASDLERDDVLQEGRIAAWLALERVPGSVPGYLVTRIRGAMRDAMRDASWVPRSAYSDEGQMRMSSATTLRDDQLPIEMISADHGPGMAAVMQVIEQMRHLPEQQAAVAGLLAEGMDGAEIGRRLGVSASRVCQIKAGLEAWARQRL